MVELPKDPRGWELEDFVAAHFVSRGCYVETGVKERGPDELLELDIVWTDYRSERPIGRPVEVKSGDWGLGEIFKFYGWTRYLGLDPGVFIHRETCGRLSPASLKHVQDHTGISILHVPSPEDVEPHFRTLGLPKPAWEDLPELWRFSFWAQRRLLKSLNVAIAQGLFRESAKAAKEYHQLINDAVFFIPDVRDRVGVLLEAHLAHKELGASAAYEHETGKVDFENPPHTATFHHASFWREHLPIQACLYLAHRARLYVLKAVVEYWLARERGDIKKTAIKFGSMLIDLTSGRLSTAMAAGVEELSEARSFKLFPVFWQVLLWSWGGFLLTDRLEEEYQLLADETGVLRDEVPIALSAFDKLFPTAEGWFREPPGDQRRVLTLVPQALRGIGAHRRLAYRSIKEYKDLGYNTATTNRMIGDNNTAIRLLECEDRELTK